MSDRITQKDLECLTNRVNEATKSPMTYSTRQEGVPNKINVGNYHLEYAYGGVRLSRTVNDGGGITVVSGNGFGTKRELYSWLQAFLAGIAV